MSRANTPTLVDADDRELAANDLSQVYLVEAAAGTGKTTLLVSRILTIVRETLTPLSRVVAITFTEKAAGDLKMKLREKLEEAAHENDEHIEQYRKALHELDAMPVSTIHAFCRELIAQRPVEAGVDPSFAVTDEATARALADEAWQTWIAEEFSTDCPEARPFLERGLDTDGNGSSLRDLFDLLNDYREDLDQLHVPFADETAIMQDVARFREEVERTLQLGMLCRDAKDSLAQELEILSQWFARRKWDNPGEAMTSLLERGKPNGNKKGRKDNWPPDVLEEVREYLFKVFEPGAEALLARLTSFHAAPLIEWLKGGVMSFGRLKSERNVLDFQDLLITARNMLQTSRAARDYFKARYDYVLVDEFQDTDPLQAEIIFFLAERNDVFAEIWDEVVLDSAKLFIVGDPKQSIYRFRRADLDLYGRVKQKISQYGQSLSIRMNFRSDPAIIREVNATFHDWMIGPTANRYEPEYAAMEAARERPSAEATTIFLPPPASLDLSQSVEKLALSEAACIAEYIRDLIASGRAVAERKGEAHTVSYRDIGILYSATTHLNSLENALRSRAIPYQVSGGKDLPRRTEIQTLRTVLAALDNPFDAVSVVGALRSPFFACSDEELIKHRLRGGRFDYTGPGSSEPHMQRSFELLCKLHERSRRLVPSETVAMLFEETSGLQVFALKPQGESRAANLLKVLEIARALETGGNPSLHQLVRWLDRLEELRVGEEDSPIAETGDDVVQLMTIHKAKGLEFPVVILYHLSQDHELRRANCIVDRNQKSVEFKMSGVQTAGYEQALQDEQDRQWHETLRLLYVAMTRARDLLIIPAFWSRPRAAEKQDRQWFFRILKSRFAPNEQGIPTVLDGEFRLHDTSDFSLEVPLEEKLVLDMEASYSALEASDSREACAAWTRRRTAAIAMLDHHDLFVKPSDHEPLSAEASQSLSADAEGAKRFGIFVHRVLQRIALPDGGNVDELIEAAAVEFGMGETERSEARVLVKRILTSELFTRRVCHSDRTWRELEFVVELDGALVEGSMDLVFMEDNRPVIVDFKTDRVSAEFAPVRAETYMHQAAAYVRALEEITGKTVAEVLLYFVRADILISLPREKLLDLPL